MSTGRNPSLSIGSDNNGSGGGGHHEGRPLTRLEIERMSHELCGDSTLGYCGRCIDFKKQEDMFKTPPCGHTICNECMSNHVALNLTNNNLHVPCPFKDCDLIFNHPRCFRSIIPPDVFRRWVNTLIEHGNLLELHAQDSNKRTRLD